MRTSIENRDLTKQSPHSPRERFGGFAILARTVDKCRANRAGKLGDYHYDCPLDNQLFGFKGIHADQFEATVIVAKCYEDVADWLQTTGTPKTAPEIKAWSDQMETTKLKELAAKQPPDHQKEIADSCRNLGLDFGDVTLFEWLEADDEASLPVHVELGAK